MSLEHDVLTPVRPRKPTMAGTGAATDLLLPQALFYNTFLAQNAEALFLKASKLFPALPNTQESQWTRTDPQVLS